MAGYTYRVSVMFDVFDDVSKGKYERSSIVSATKQHPACPLRFSENGQLVALGKSLDDVSNKFIMHWGQIYRTKVNILSI